MTEQEIQQELNEIARRAMARGISQVAARIWFQSEADITAIFEGFDDVTTDRIYDVWHVDTLEAALTKFGRRLAKFSSREDRERNEYLKRIASAIEYGKKIGIDEAFINPLELQMKKLSANIIEYTPTAPATNLNDDIPF